MYRKYYRRKSQFWSSVCLLNIRTRTTPCTWSSIWLWYCSSLFRVSAWCWSRRKAPGYVTIQTENFCNNLNWIMHLRATAFLFTLSLHWQLTSKAQNQSCSWGKNHETQMGNSCTVSLLHHWAGFNITTIPLCPVYLECVLSIRRPLPGGFRRTDRWDRRTKIAKQLQ